MTTTKRPEYDGPDRRTDDATGNGYGLLGGLPAWAKVVSVIGLPGAIAAFLVYQNTQALPAIQQQLIVVGEQNKRIQELVLEHDRQAEDLLRLMQRICANTAKDDTREQRCFDR